MNYEPFGELDLVSIIPEAASWLVNGRAIRRPAGSVSEPSQPPVRSHLAIAEFDGALTAEAYSDLRSWLYRSRVDPSVETAVLRMRSPGGPAEGCAETFEYGFRLAKKKPFIVLAEGYLTSAALYVASAATEIYASPTCFVGSCGVISVLHDQSELFKRSGIQVIPITTGAAKADGLPGTKVTEEIVARVRKRIDGLQILFRKNLRRAGRMTAQQREDAFESADVYLAEEAVSRGLIDGVMIPEDWLEQSDVTTRNSTFTHLRGAEAYAKFESLVCDAANSPDACTAPNIYFERTQTKYPGLSRQRDDYLKSLKPAEAKSMIDDLICQAAGVSSVWQASEEFVEKVRKKYPLLASHFNS